MNKLKYNIVTQKIIKLLFNICSHWTIHYVFCASTGRSGTTSLQHIFKAAENAYTTHESHPIMNKDVLINYNNGDIEAAELEFNTRKLLRIAYKSLFKEVYVESNHMFIKCFADPAFKVFKKKLKVVVLERDPVAVALSMLARGDIPGEEGGNKWVLDPRATQNIIKIEKTLYENPGFAHDFYKCLWYCFEIKARTLQYQKRHPDVPLFFIKTEELNDFERNREMLEFFKITYNESRLKELTGTRANVGKKNIHLDQSFKPENIDEFYKLCERAM
jgi:hypothetical protein